MFVYRWRETHTRVCQTTKGGGGGFSKQKAVNEVDARRKGVRSGEEERVEEKAGGKKVIEIKLAVAV